MKKLLVALLALSAPAAFADGFVCQNSELNVQVYNNTNPTLGTRNAAVFVVSDPSVAYGRKTIARFTQVKGTLTNRGPAYLALVDLGVADSARAGENIGGTKLGELATIELDVEFNYNAPVSAGSPLKGWVTLNKHNGQSRTLYIECQRYLKN